MAHKMNSIWTELSPIRKKFLKICIPAWLAITLIPLLVCCVLLAIDVKRFAFLMGIWGIYILVVSLVFFIIALPKLIREERLLQLYEQYGYLTQDAFVDGEEFETVDDETGIVYTVQKSGLKIVFPLPEGYVQVFDETPDNVVFLPWERTRMGLATSNEKHSVKMAVAVLDVSTALLEEDGETSYEEPFFLPLDERLIRAIKSFGLEEKTDGGWAYLLYNPYDAIKQIYKRGYIRVLRDKYTGKIITDKEWEDIRD